MSTYTVEDLQNRYEDKPSKTTIYNYFKREDIKPYVIEDGGLRLTEDGIIVLDTIRAKNKKYRVIKEERQDVLQENTEEKQENKDYNNSFNDMIQTLKKQLEIKDEQIQEKDKQIEQKDLQISKLHDIIQETTQTIAMQNGTLQLKEHNEIIKGSVEKQEIIYTGQDTTARPHSLEHTEERKGIVNKIKHFLSGK